jgi:hypothetical protein
MYDLFAVGGTFPRVEDVPRLERYASARQLYDGEHQNHEDAKRISQKLAETGNLSGTEAEGVVYLVYNLPRLICLKFADLQVLQNPLVMMEAAADEKALKDALRDDVPNLWALIHEAKSLGRSRGDVVLDTSKRAESGSLDLRVIDPSRWFPVFEGGDHLTVAAHQIAWVESFEEDRKTVTYLRVDICTPNRVDRKAFILEADQRESQSTHKITAEVELATHWPDAAPVDTADLGGLMSCHHIANGRLRSGEIFGRPEFLDSAGLIDDINWRLSTWSDANDRVAHSTEVVPAEWIEQDDDGHANIPSQYRRRYVGARGRTADSPLPIYMQYPLDHVTLREGFESSVLALLLRHEMAPGLLGLQFGKEKESGEAKSLSMGTTEAATRRDLMAAQPAVDGALTALARMGGNNAAQVTTHWRVGLPKTRDQLMTELETERRLGAVTQRDILERLYPFWSDVQFDQKLEELKTERAEAIAEATPELTPEVG